MPAAPHLTLDGSQSEAVLHDGGPALVLGEAGSGKTTVLVERAGQLLGSGVPRERILVLALSRINLDELSGRLTTRLGVSSPAVMTIHAFAFDLVRWHHREMGYAHPPRRLSSRDARQQLKRSLDRWTPGSSSPYRHALGSRTLLALLTDLMAGAANNALNPEEMRAALQRAGRADLSGFVPFHRHHQALLKQQSLVEAEGAILEALRLLESRPHLAQRLRDRYPHILIDEFEQATCVQARLVRLLAPAGLFIAGNPDEATNSYRGGSPAYLRELAGCGELQLLRLGPSRRSAPTIREAHARLLSGTICPDSEEPAQEVLTIHPFRYQRDEVAWLAGEIVSLLQSGVGPGEIAVLFRYGGDPIARELSSRLLAMGVPIRAMEQALSVESDPMVVAAVDVLRTLLAPLPDRDALFLKLLVSPLGGLTRAELRGVLRLASGLGLAPLTLALDPVSLSTLAPGVAELVAGLAGRLIELEGHIAEPPDDLLWRIWSLFPAFAAQSIAWSAGRYDDSPGSPAAFRALLEEVSEIVHDTASAGVAELIALFDAGHFREITYAPATGNGPGVRITTVHQARGAEWPYLFLPNLVEGVYPLRGSPIGNLAPILLRGGDGEPELVRDHHLAEEKRLLGVAISRARGRLFISYSGTALDGTTRLFPSRYVGTRTEKTASLSPQSSALSPDLVAGCRRRIWGLDPALATGEASLEEWLDAAEALYTLSRLAELYPSHLDPARWWDLVQETRGAASPYPDGSLYLSASRLTLYRECPLKYKFAQHLQLDDVSSDAMTLGTLVHAVLEEYHRPGAAHAPTREAMEGLLDRLYDESQFSRPAIARQVRLVASGLLDLYFPLYGRGADTLAVEASFRFRLGPHTLSGRIDRVDRLPDGSLELIDYKTSSHAMPVAEASDDLQLALYDLAFQHQPELAGLGEPSMVTYLYPRAITPATAAKMANPDPKKPPKITRGRGDGRRGYSPTEEGREKLLARIDRYSQGILAELFPSRSLVPYVWNDLEPEEIKRLQKDSCRYCGFSWLCPEKERGTADD